MKTILWAALTANGNYARSDAEHAPNEVAMADFGRFMQQTGNFIVGRRTFEGFQASGAKLNPNVDVVVLSQRPFDVPGVKTALTPQEALAYLREKGHETTVLAGGETLHNLFLEQGLVDEIIFDIIPTLEDEGLKVILPHGQYKKVELLDSKTLEGGVVRNHYEIK